MNKILIFLIAIFNVYLFNNICNLPNINYTKVEYVSYSTNQSSSLSSGNDATVSPNCITIQLNLDYTFCSDLVDSRSELDNNTYLSKRELKDIKRERKAKAKEYHEGKNNEIWDSIRATTYQDLFVSSYAPFIDITYDLQYFMRHKEDILNLFTNNELVKNVSVLEGYQDYEDYMTNVAQFTHLGDVYTNRTKTGIGVAIGLLETGVVDVDHPDLQNSIITVRSHALNFLRSQEHATEMAMIICGDNGIAPDAALYSAGIFGATVTAEIEWLLDNDVDLINMSCGDGGSMGTYNSTSAYIDYIIAQNYVILTASTGNDGEGSALIDNPGLAYNAITVTGNTCNDILGDYASYLVEDGPIKPTISMYGSVKLRDTDSTSVEGTSISAALVAGMLALIVQQHSSLVVNKEQLYALICTNAINPYSPHSSEENGFLNTLGAGIMDYGNIIDNYSNSGMTYSSGTVALNSAIFTKTVYVQSGKKIRASIASIASSNGTVSGISYTDYDLFIKDPSGNVVAVANSTDSIIELAECVAATSGNYTIQILQASTRVKNKDYIGYAYRIY